MKWFRTHYPNGVWFTCRLQKDGGTTEEEQGRQSVMCVLAGLSGPRRFNMNASLGYPVTFCFADFPHDIARTVGSFTPEPP